MGSTTALRELFKAHATRKGFRGGCAELLGCVTLAAGAHGQRDAREPRPQMVARSLSRDAAPPAPARRRPRRPRQPRRRRHRRAAASAASGAAPPAPARGGLGGSRELRAAARRRARIPKRERSPRAAPAEGSAHERRMLRQKDKARRKKSKFSPPVEGPFLAAYGPGDAGTTTQVGASGSYGAIASETYGPAARRPSSRPQNQNSQKRLAGPGCSRLQRRRTATTVAGARRRSRARRIPL